MGRRQLKLYCSDYEASTKDTPPYSMNCGGSTATIQEKIVEI
uniref:Uncharacterized protein n=1 Tax=Romanomermis culicivorax TaxID=13658 RepID=A0A915J946_ROMCU